MSINSLIYIQKKKNREDCWIGTLRISYPYGLNERKRKADQNLAAGYLFPPIPRCRQRSGIFRNNANFDKLKDMRSICNCIHNYITDDIKNAFYHIGILLSKNRKKYL